MINSKLNNIIDSLKLQKKDRAELDRILSRPEVKAVLDADENDQLERRKALAIELKAIPDKITQLHAEHLKGGDAVVARLKTAEKEYLAAKKAHHDLVLAGHYIGSPEKLRAKEITRELISGSDVRIHDFRFELDKIKDSIKLSEKYWIEHGPKNFLGKSETFMRSNMDDVNKAGEELQNGINLLNKLELAAKTNNEITQILINLSEHLVDSLKKLDKNPPTIDENGKVKPPMIDGNFVVKDKLKEKTAH